MAGAKHFVRTPLGRAVSAAIVCEPEQNELCLEQKGVFWARVIVHGRMAHGAMPYAGVNPIPAAGRFLAGLPALERRVQRSVRRSRFLGIPHVTPTAASAPVGHVAQNNVIPATAELRLDVRLTPGVEAGDVLGALEALARDTEQPMPGFARRRRARGGRPARHARRARRGGRQGARVGRAAGQGTAARLRRRAGLDRWHDPAHRPRHSDRHVRAREPADSPPGRRARPRRRALGSGPLLRSRSGAVPLAPWLITRESPKLRPVEAFPAEVENREVVCLRDPSGVTDAVLSVPRSLAPILALFDGVRTLVDVQAEIMRHSGELVLRSQLESMVEVLDQHLFLEGPRLEAERARQRATFLSAATRPAFLAGRSYDEEPEALGIALTSHFVAPDGPGPIGSPRGVTVHGLVAPHIDFNRGGPAYAWAYRALAEAEAADCFIVLGTAHAGLDGHPFAATAKPFETPFGPLEVDREVLDAVARRAPTDLMAAELAHRSEHSIEFQAVWLQYLGPARRRPRSAHRAAPRKLRQRVPRPRREPRPGRRHRSGTGGRARRDGRRPAPLLHRRGRRPRARRSPLRGRVAGHLGGAGTRRGGGPGAPRPRRLDATRRDSSRRPDGRRTGTGSADCRRSTPSCGSCPEGRGGFSAMVSGPIRTGPSRSPA